MRSLVLATLVVALVGCGGKAQVQGDLTVSGTPTGEITGPMRVILVFGKPMVAGPQVGKPTTALPFTVDPALPGVATWTDDKTLAYVPSASMPIATKYTLTVPGTTKAVDGALVGKDYKLEFFTEKLTGEVGLVGANDKRAPKAPLAKIEFNQEVAFDQVAQHCSFTSVKAGAQKVKLGKDSSPGPNKSYLFEPVADLALDSDYKLTCTVGLKGTVGNMGTDEVVELPFHTYGPLKFVKLDPAGNDLIPDENLVLNLQFTNPIAQPYAIKIDPPVKGFPERCHDLGGEDAGLACGVPLEALTSYTITIDAATKDTFGQTLGAPQTVAFRTADAEPTISAESGYYVAELTHPQVPVWTRNVKSLTVKAIQVTPANLHQLSPKIDWWSPKPVELGDVKLTQVTKKIDVTGTKNQWAQHPLGAAELFNGQNGPGMFYLEIGSDEVTKGAFDDGGVKKVLVNFTDIGAVSKISGSKGAVWATKLSTGKPLAGATVQVRDQKGKVTFTGTTDAMGICDLPPTSKIEGKRDPEDYSDENMRVYVTSGADWTMLNPHKSGGLSPWSFNVSYDPSESTVGLRGFMHTDRGLYRPGDKVHVKGLARLSTMGGPLAAPDAGKKIKVTVEDPRGSTTYTTDAKFSAFGGFWFDLDLPEDARLGDYSIRATTDWGSFSRTFSVEEFKTATFEVNGKLAKDVIIRRGDVAATIEAKYLYGAPLRSGSVDVSVYSRPREWQDIKGYDDYSFHDDRKYQSYNYYGNEPEQTLVTEDKVALDDKGNAKFSVPVTPNDIFGGDADLLIRAAVTSPANETISKSFAVRYNRSTRYFGIKSPGWMLEAGKPAKYSVVSVGPDGKPADGPAHVTVTRRDWNCVWEDWGYRGSYQCEDKTATLLDKQITLSGGKPTDIEFNADHGGDYLVVVEGVDDKAKDETSAAASQMYAWGGDDEGSWRSSDSLSFDIVTDKKEYKAGDTATLILKTDLSQATGLVTIERDGVMEKRLIEVTPKTKQITVPITAAYAPNVYVSVALVQGRTGEGPRGKPRMRMGVVNLPVHPEETTLKVTVETDKKDYRPGGDVTATVKVTDSKGAPVSAEVSITAADEGVLQLIDYKTPDPVPTFYAPWGLGVSTATQYEYVKDLPGPNLQRPASGGDSSPGSMRSKFVSTPVWVPGAVTDANGIATVTFKAPDNLTAFRVMAVVADNAERFGSAEQRFTVSKPLQLFESLPRLLRLGDKLQGGVVVHNETGKAGTATVKLVVDDKLAATGPLEKQVQLAVGAQVPAMFELTGKSLGDAKLQFTVSMGGEKDGLELMLPVQHPSAVKSFHIGHAALKDAATVKVSLPAEAETEGALLVISADPDGLSGIEQGLADLIEYPYGCIEQTTSKVIPMIAVRELANQLALKGLAGPALDGFVKQGITKIGKFQSESGGFSLWMGGEPEAYYTAYALWGLKIAKDGGYKVDQTRVDDALNYLRNDGKTPDTTRPYYNAHGDASSQAFALYVRALWGDKDAAAATALATNKDLTMFGKAWIMRALAIDLGKADPAVAKLADELAGYANTATKTDALIHDPAEDKLYYYMSSDMRTTASVLAALVDVMPKNDAIRPLVRTIMKARRSHIGGWWDTQENLHSLLALSSFSKTQTQNNPSVDITLAGTSVLKGALSGKTRMRAVSLPFAAGDVVITPSGGEVNYSIDVRYREKPSTIKAQANGITVTREYFDEQGNKKTAFQVNEVVVVKVTADMKDEEPHLMLSDPIPAGFEVLNTALKTTGGDSVKQTEEWGTYREIHDDRVDFASEWTWGGNHMHEYSMRAVASGTFTLPPAHAELMYQPEVNGQTGISTIEIKGK
ncbi:MAG TPA: MG2 domain-containing protein [Kofleriaceae bacterium]|jgi:hypothetical protein